MTHFGRAVFDVQLRKTLSFEEAFNAAVPVIKKREIEAKKADGFPPRVASRNFVTGCLTSDVTAGLGLVGFEGFCKP